MAAVQAPKRRLKLVRVKRKRDSEAPEDLVVEGLEAPGKRAHTSLSSTLAELSLGGQAAAAEGAAQAPIGDGADATAAAPAVRRQRFRRLSTLSAAQLRSIDGDQLASLLAAQQEVAAARRAGVKSSAGGGAGAAAAAAGRAAQQLQAGQAARYEQVQRRRGLAGPAAAGGASVAGAEADPLQQLASVYDLVRRDGSEQGAPAAAAAAGPGAAAAGQQQAQRRPSRAEQAAAQYDEGTLLCNYMPMIREYLASQGRPLPAEGEGPAAASGGQAGSGDDSQQGSDVTAGAAQQAPPSGSQGAGPAGQDSEGDEYVYDIYAALSEDEGGEGREAEEQWWELHASGAAPVVQIIDDDTWLVIEQPDAEGSNSDSEDSNAEGFYAHDYPDESSSAYDSSVEGDDDGYDPEGDTFHRTGAVGRQQRQRGGWDEQSYGSDASWE